METRCGICLYQSINLTISVYHACVMDIPLVISLSSKRRPFACTKTKSAFSKLLFTCSVKSWTLALVLVMLKWRILCCVPNHSKKCELSTYQVNSSLAKTRQFSEIALFSLNVVLTLHLVYSSFISILFLLMSLSCVVNSPYITKVTFTEGAVKRCPAK